MKRKTGLLGTALIILAFIATACERTTPTPTCPTGSLIAPIPDSPLSGDAGLPINLMFSWHYPDTCEPEGYRIDVTTQGGYDYGETHSGGTGNPSTDWLVGTDLEPATHYEWRVAAINGTTLGPYSRSQHFWTGPYCETAALLVPTQLGPADGATTDMRYPPLNWDYGNPCTPRTFDVDLDTDPSFPGPNLVGDFDPVTDYPFIALIPLAELTDCSVYYWRVRALNTDGASPFSPTRSFTTNFSGLCEGGAVAPPYCEAGSLIAPTDLHPEYFSIVSSTPNLWWVLVDSCVPEHYHIELTDRLDNIDPSIMLDVGISGDSLGADPSWIAAALAPATQYWWKVAGVVGGTTGPYSTRSSFITGPSCDASELLGPTLEFPANGAEINAAQIWLSYNPTSLCTPPDYYVDLQTDAGFPGPNLMLGGGPDATVGAPSTFVQTPTLTDCTLYFWRVAAQHGTTRGPWSDTFSFFTNFGGTCTSPFPLSFSFGDNACLEFAFPGTLTMGYVLDGDYAKLIATNLEGTWYLVPNPNNVVQNCWVPVDKFSAPIGLIGFLPAVTTFEPTAAPTGCFIYDQNQNLSCVVPCPANASPGTACTP